MKKKIFIPGWMDTVENRVDFEGLDIWKNNLPLKHKMEAEYVIGHCAGANYALFNWNENKECKLILVDPAIAKRNILSWLLRIFGFWIFEGTKISRERTKSFKYFFQSIPKIIKLLRIDMLEIIRKIPRENLFIIRGKNDRFLFDLETAEELKREGIEIIEVEGAGHNLDEKIIEEVNKLID